MSWNDQLYLYVQKRGGVYLGRMDSKSGQNDEAYMQHGGVAVLEYKGTTLLIKSWSDIDRYTIRRGVQVQLNCELERPYRCSISRKNALRKGLSGILGQKNNDYGVPEATAGRSIKTDDREFTKMVLRDLDLRNALMNNPGYGLDIEPNTPNCVGGGGHCITAWCRLDTGAAGSTAPEWDIIDLDDDWGTPEQIRKRLDSEMFAQKLDDLVALAKAAHNAVTTWRMPVISCEVKK